MMSVVKWWALESNPDIMNKFLENLGVPKNWRISDIISLDEELLCLVPSPLFAVLLLFPFSEKDNEYCQEQEHLLKAGAQEGVDSSVYFMFQSISNACGTIALIHAIANNVDKLNLSPDVLLMKFIENTKFSSPHDKATTLEHSREIATALEASLDGRNLGDKCDYHFITLVEVNCKLYELDGRKTAPVLHGNTSKPTFLTDAVRVCKEFMARDPDNMNFTALAFGASSIYSSRH